MYDDTIATAGGIVGDPVVEKPKSRAEKVQDWKKEHEAEYRTAYNACCVCSPSRAQRLLVDQYEGDDRDIPV